MARSMVAPSALAWTARTSPTMTPRILTSEASCNWLPAVSVSSVTRATGVNAFWYVATASPSSSARTTMNASPWIRIRTFLLIARSPRDPDGRRRAPDGERQEEVDDVHRDDREPDRPAHGQADARRTAAGAVAVVAVGQDDHDREDEDLQERPQHVLRRQEQVEVVVVGAGRLPVGLRGDQPGGEVAGEQPEDVQRDDGHEPGDDPGGHEEGQRGDAHDLEGVDLLVDPHGPDLRGEPASDRRRQREAGHQRRDLAGVEVRRQEAGEGRGAEL